MRPLPRLPLLICLAAAALPVAPPPVLAQAQGFGATAADRLRIQQQTRVLSGTNPALGRIDQRLDLHQQRSRALTSPDPADLAEVERRRRLLLLERQRALSAVEPPSAAPETGARTSASGAPGTP